MLTFLVFVLSATLIVVQLGQRAIDAAHVCNCSGDARSEDGTGGNDVYICIHACGARTVEHRVPDLHVGNCGRS